jgi:hypothetical protein
MPKVISLCAFFVDYLIPSWSRGQPIRWGQSILGRGGKLALQRLSEEKEALLNIFIVFLSIFLNK